MAQESFVGQKSLPNTLTGIKCRIFKELQTLQSISRLVNWRDRNINGQQILEPIKTRTLKLLWDCTSLEVFKETRDTNADIVGTRECELLSNKKKQSSHVMSCFLVWCFRLWLSLLNTIIFSSIHFLEDIFFSVARNLLCARITFLFNPFSVGGYLY